LTEVAVFHSGMAQHTGSLRAISFLGDQSVSQPVLRPGNHLVALDPQVVEIYLLEASLDSAGGHGHRIGDHDKACRSHLRLRGLHLVKDDGGTVAVDLYQARAFQVIRPNLARGCGRLRQSQRKLRVCRKPFIERLLGILVNVERKFSLNVLLVSTDREFGKLRPGHWRSW